MGKKAKLKEIRRVAARMPLQFQESQIRIKGEAIIDEAIALAKEKDIAFKLPTDGAGNVIDRDKWYTVPTQQPVNHYRRLKRALFTKGVGTAKEYITDVLELEQRQYEHHANVIEGLPNQAIINL